MTPEMRAVLANLDVQDREAFDERAAILEFDCGMSREQADAAAYREITHAILRRRVNTMAQHQAQQVKPLTMPRHDPVVDGKTKASGFCVEEE